MQNKIRCNYEPIENLGCVQVEKKVYFFHFRNPKFYVRMGMKLTKLKRVTIFRQKSWMKNYIIQNTEFRANSTFEFGKLLCKK